MGLENADVVADCFGDVEKLGGRVDVGGNAKIRAFDGNQAHEVTRKWGGIGCISAYGKGRGQGCVRSWRRHDGGFVVYEKVREKAGDDGRP